MASGVATYLKSDELRRVEMVTQAGPVPVTNPDSSAQPEVVDGPFLVLRQRSSLVQLGATVMSWPTDYSGLLDLFESVADGYQQFYPDKNTFLLDFEYKKVQPGRLEVKQVRSVEVIVPGAWFI